MKKHCNHVIIVERIQFSANVIIAQGMEKAATSDAEFTIFSRNKSGKNLW